MKMEYGYAYEATYTEMMRRVEKLHYVSIDGNMYLKGKIRRKLSWVLFQDQRHLRGAKVQAKNIEILPSLRILIPDVKYAINRLAYYLPMLPKDMLSEETKIGELQHDLWVPLEDLYNGWETN